jgi:hypothetical protein
MGRDAGHPIDGIIIVVYKWENYPLPALGLYPRN